MKARHLLCDDTIKWPDESGRIRMGKITGIVKTPDTDDNIHIQIDYTIELYVSIEQEFDLVAMTGRT